MKKKPQLGDELTLWRCWLLIIDIKLDIYQSYNEIINSESVSLTFLNSVKSRLSS
ncbi:hypothetical protein D3C76_1781500 [compost metagenome]